MKGPRTRKGQTASSSSRLAKKRRGKETRAREQVASTRNATPLEREGKN